MQTETANSERLSWRSTAPPLIQILDRRLALILALALLAGFLAYQAPPVSTVLIGWLGDRLFLHASEWRATPDGLGFYADELTPDAQSGRSRWTHRAAGLTFPGLGAGDLVLDVRAQGWPQGVQNLRTTQPLVLVEVDGAPLDTFIPAQSWADYRLHIPATARTGPDLYVVLRSSDVFTNTLAGFDPREKGVRIESVRVSALPASDPFVAPAPVALLMLLITSALWLLALVALTNRPTLGFVLATLWVAGVAIGLALARAWVAALLPWALLAGGLLLGYVWRTHGLRFGARLLRRFARGSALNYGMTGAAAAWLALMAAEMSVALELPGPGAFWENFPDSLLFGLLGMGLALLVMVRGRNGLPRLSHALVRGMGSRWGATGLLALLVLVWVGYLGYAAVQAPGVGHADYADNAVVARNLVAGRGWVVDYVTQFYQLYSGTTRPQETWPLLQPLWIAPFFALFGAHDWVAKLPNLGFISVLALVIFMAGTRLWDRRVGLTAALFVLTSHLFFKLVIDPTTDLAFVVFSFGAIVLVYEWGAHGGATGRVPGWRGYVARPWLVAATGVVTGLMMLQKPAGGVLIAVGMGLWLLMRFVRQAAKGRWRDTLLAGLMPIVLWTVIALLVLSPYLARNVLLFKTLFYSTESYDAWVLGYTDWEDIYKVYTPEAGLSETRGLPDRSWILRWGFDRTQAKIETQIRALRNYLAPAWSGLPLGLSELLSGKRPLLSHVGAWLAVLGAIGALHARRRLSGLLLAAFGPYTLFLLIYWRADEDRYFVMLIPWLALLAAFALWYGYDRIAAIGDGRWTPVALALVGTAIVLVVHASWPEIEKKIVVEPQIEAVDQDAHTWLRDHTPPGSVVMTRVPWQLNWTSERPAVMIPNTTNPELLLRLARHYNARYLVLDATQRPGSQAQRMIERMVADPALGFQEVYRTRVYLDWVGVTVIYRFPDNYGGVAPIRS